MVPARSVRVSRVPTYSGYRHVPSAVAYGDLTLFVLLSQNSSADLRQSITRSEPRNACTPVWPLTISLAATFAIDVSFFSSGYLDVSVHRVPHGTLWIHVPLTGSLLPGLPIQKSQDHGICAPPLSLSQLITSFIGSQCQGIRPALFLDLSFIKIVASSFFPWFIVNKSWFRYLISFIVCMKFSKNESRHH